MKKHKCTECKIYKKKNCFYKRGESRPDEIEAKCKACRLGTQKEKIKSEHKKNPRKCQLCKSLFVVSGSRHRYCSVKCQEKRNRKKRAEWQKKNIKRARFLQLKWRTNNPKKAKYRYRKHRLKKKYGLTIFGFEKLRKKQKNKCSICKRKFGLHIGPPHVDHKHGKEGTHRGLLCALCNFLVGNCREKTQILLSAIQYIRKWEKS